RRSSSSTTDVLELLRRAKVLATRLRQPGDVVWIDHEINGYQPPAPVPSYRIIPSELRTRNPYHGWNAVAWGGPSKVQEHFASAEIRSPIAEVVEVTKADGEPRASLVQAEMDVLTP